MATGLRRTNAAQVKREHIDRRQKLLTVPKTKEGRPFVLPLNDLALEAIDAAPRDRRRGRGKKARRVQLPEGYVFTVSAKPLNAWTKMVKRLRPR